MVDPVQRTNIQLYGVGLGLALVDRGWTLHTNPGTFHLGRGSEYLNPFQVVNDLITGEISPESWQEHCAAWDSR